MIVIAGFLPKMHNNHILTTIQLLLTTIHPLCSDGMLPICDNTTMEVVPYLTCLHLPLSFGMAWMLH